jgi:hypothetical protein
MLLLVAVLLVAAGAVPRPGWEWAEETLRPPVASAADPSVLLAPLTTVPCCWGGCDCCGCCCCCCCRLLLPPLRPRLKLPRRPSPLSLRRGLFFSGARRWQNLNTSPMPW